MKALYWLRQDLRLHDNRVLMRYGAEAKQGLILWCPTPSFWRADAKRRQFILASLLVFKHKIEALGGAIWISDASVVKILPKIIQKHSIDRLYFSTEPTPEEQAEEAFVKSRSGLDCVAVGQGSLIQEQDLPFAIEALPKVFTQFRKKIEINLQILAPLPAIRQVPAPLDGLEWQKLASWDLQDALKSACHHPQIEPGEDAGLARVEDYIFKKDRLRFYKETRNGMLDWDDSSKLSPWLSCGALSPRHVYAAIQNYEATRCINDSTYWLFFELLWRDYFRFSAMKLKAALFNQISPYSENFGTVHERESFEAWCVGRSPDAFVNANMNELNQTGWMSNRGRQNVASYLAKTLKVNWIWGAEYFEKKLIDYDAASNWGNWAYLAGVGQDPRDRVFNTKIQAQRYDPLGLYQKIWTSSDPK